MVESMSGFTLMDEVQDQTAEVLKKKTEHQRRQISDLKRLETLTKGFHLDLSAKLEWTTDIWIPRGSQINIKKENYISQASLSIMWLAFAAKEATGYFFVGLVSGPRAYSMASWMRNETVEAESMTLNGIPVIMFSGHEANTSDHQNGSWVRANLIHTKSINQQWVWSSTKTKMPPRVVKTFHSFELTVNLSTIYSCRSLLLDGVPLLEELANKPPKFIQLGAQVVNIIPVNLAAQPTNVVKVGPFSSMSPPDTNPQ